MGKKQFLSKKFFLFLLTCLLGICTWVAAEDAAFKPAVVVEHGFENNNLHGWLTRGGLGALSFSNEAAHSGTSSLKMSGRTVDWHMARVELTNLLQKGAKYSIEIFARLPAGEKANPMAINIITRTAAGDTEVSISGDVNVTDAAWVKLNGETLFDKNAIGLYLYVYLKNNPTGSYLVDDLKITIIAPAPPVTQEETVSMKYSFENGNTEGWGPRGGVQVASVTEAAQTGTSSLKTTGRTASWMGPSLDAKSLLKKGAVYEISGYVKLVSAPATASTVKFTMEEKPTGGNTGWKTISQQSIAGTDWTKLTGQYTFAADMDNQALYAESSNAADAFYLDNVIITMTAPPPELTIQKEIPALKDVFAADFAIGAAVEPSMLTGLNAQLLKKHFNAIVAENVMKPISIQPIEGVFAWDDADKIFQYAKANNMLVRFHTLEWHTQVPAWLFLDKDGKDMTLETDAAKKQANKTLLLQRLEKHITAVVDRYKDQVDSWDVVNEVVDTSGPNGMRDNNWYKITGTDYIELAFRTARKAAGPKAKLFINDYNTEEPKKRDILYKLVKDLKAKGVPIDGVGHQMHINWELPSIVDISASIKLFGEMGLDNQLTEMDVSAYTNNTAAYTKVPQDILVEQGYRFKTLFDEFRKLNKYISCVIFWGVADDHTWLHNRPIQRRDAPLVFDEQYLAKPAYWGMVDPSKLPVLTQKLDVNKDTPVVDGMEEVKWKLLGWIPVKYGTGITASYKIRWDEQHLYLLADVKDAKKSAKDIVEIYVDENNGKTGAYQPDDQHFILDRAGKGAGGQVIKVKESKGGYLLEAAITLKTAVATGKQLGFDIRVTDADQKAAVVCWNDPTASQDTDTSKYGTITLKDAVKLTEAIKGTPKIDAAVETAWNKANTVTTGIPILGAGTTTAKVRTMWDEKYLYVLAEVTDPLLNKANANLYEQDSMEFFLDENNGKTTYYEADDAQYRVNYENLQSFGANGSDARFKSAVKLVTGGYIVEAAIPFKTIKGAAGLILGFDTQVNEAGAEGRRVGISIWSDASGNGFRDMSRLGCLVTKK